MQVGCHFLLYMNTARSATLFLLPLGLQYCVCLLTLSDILERKRSRIASMHVIGTKTQPNSKEPNKMACKAKNGSALKEKWDAMTAAMTVMIKPDGHWHVGITGVAGHV